MDILDYLEQIKIATPDHHERVLTAYVNLPNLRIDNGILYTPDINEHADLVEFEASQGGWVVAKPYIDTYGLKIYTMPYQIFIGTVNERGFGVSAITWRDKAEYYKFSKWIIRKIVDYLAKNPSFDW